MNEVKIIQQIIDLKKDEIDDFINQRIAELEATTTEDRERISLFEYRARRARRARGEKENTEVVGYIPSKTKISKNQYDLATFRMDDKSLYKTIIDYIKKVNPDDIKQENRVNHNYIIKVIQCTIINYFGLRGNKSRRNAFYNSITEEDFENSNDTFSISDLKKKNIAMCAERSATAQNILSFLGYNPMMIYGFLSSEKGTVNEGHAFNCIIRDGKAMLIDFTNPIMKDGKYLKPAQFPIDEENLKAFMKGKAQIEVQHKDLYTDNEETKEYVIPLVYSSEEIDPQYFEKRKKTVKGIITPRSVNEDTQNLGLQEINASKQDLEKTQTKNTTQEQQVSK